MMSDKTIGVVSPYPSQSKSNGDLGAMGWYTSSLIGGMDTQTRDSLVVFSNTKNGDFQEEISGTIVEYCREKDSFGFFWKIYKKILSYPYITVVHIQHEFSVFGGILSNIGYNILLLLLRLHGIRTIQTEHGVIDPNIVNKEFVKINNLGMSHYLVSIFFKIYYFFNNLVVSRHIVHEEYFKELLINHYFVSRSKVSVIPIGINDYAVVDQSIARKQLNIGIERKVLLYFGYIAGYKGLDLLLDTYKELLQKDERYFLVVAGGMPKRTADDPLYALRYTDLQKKMDTLGENMMRVGFVLDEDIATYFGASDVLVMPYKYMLAASGPMSLALAYKIGFLASDVFAPIISEKEILFHHDIDTSLCVIENYFAHKDDYSEFFEKMRTERLWKIISKQTAGLYK